MLLFKPLPFSAFWPPSGLYVASLLLVRPRRWPFFILGAFLANIASDMVHGRMLAASLLFSSGNTLEALAGAWLVRQFVGEKPTLRTTRQVLGLAGLSALLSTTISAVVGATTIAFLLGNGSFWDTWLTWWSGDALSVLVVSPLVLCLFQNSPLSSQKGWPRLPSKRILEIAIWQGGYFMSLGYVFFISAFPWFVVEYLIWPFLVWAAIRFRIRGVALTNAILAIAATWSLSHGMGQWNVIAPDIHQQVIQLQTFLAVSSFAALVLAAMINEQHQAQEIVRRSEKRYHDLADSISDIFFAIDQQLRCVYWNKASEALTGIPASQAIGKTLYELFPEIRGTSPEQNYLSVLANRQPLSFPVSYSRKGRHYFFEMHVYPTSDGLAVISRDISAHVQAEELFHRSELQNRTILQTALDGFWLIDLGGKLIEVNDAYCQMSGYTRQELIGMTVDQLDIHDSPLEVDNRIRQVVAQGAQRFEAVHRRKDGSTYPIEVSVKFLPIDGGKLYAFLRDIAERKQTEEKLRQSEERYYSFISQSFEGIYRTELDQPIDTSLPVETQIDLIYEYAYMAECNQAMASMYKMPSPESFIGQRMIDIHDGKDNPINRATFRKFIEDGYKSVNDETVEKSFDSKPVWFLSNTIGIVENGYLVRLWGTQIDITERKHIEQERDLTIRLLQLLNAPNNVRELMQAVIVLLHDGSGCEAIGIRLCSGGDYPYFETRGFPLEFVEKENRLCTYDLDGQILRDDCGNPILECMCGNILCGRFDPAKPFFTAHGSFWTNSTTELLARTSETDRQVRTRNRCNGEGYESVALIPIRTADQVFGLLQLNDSQRDRFTPDDIALYERLADNLGIALLQRQTETALRASLTEKDVLLKELHHRVKNNLQIINSLLSLRADLLHDPRAIQVFQDCQNSVRAIALVHENIYQAESMAQIDAQDYLHGLLHHLHAACGRQYQDISLEIEIAPLRLDPDRAIPCGLILTELFSNALKHAFPDEQTNRQTNKVWVTFQVQQGFYLLAVRDNGVGLPADFSLPLTRSFGLQLVEMLAQQLNGRLTVIAGVETSFQVEFP